MGEKKQPITVKKDGATITASSKEALKAFAEKKFKAEELQGEIVTTDKDGFVINIEKR
jgi:hypothetical protein